MKIESGSKNYTGIVAPFVVVVVLLVSYSKAVCLLAINELSAQKPLMVNNQSEQSENEERLRKTDKDVIRIALVPWSFHAGECLTLANSSSASKSNSHLSQKIL